MNGEGFAADAQAGELVGIYFDANWPTRNLQPFIVGYGHSNEFEECIC